VHRTALAWRAEALDVALRTEITQLRAQEALLWSYEERQAQTRIVGERRAREADATKTLTLLAAALPDFVDIRSLECAGGQCTLELAAGDGERAAQALRAAPWFEKATLVPGSSAGTSRVMFAIPGRGE
jgi:hypothetical protein